MRCYITKDFEMSTVKNSNRTHVGLIYIKLYNKNHTKKNDNRLRKGAYTCIRFKRCNMRKY